MMAKDRQAASPLRAAIEDAAQSGMDMVTVGRHFDPFLLTWTRDERDEQVFVDLSVVDAVGTGRAVAAESVAAERGVLVWGETVVLETGEVDAILIQAHERGRPSSLFLLQAYKRTARKRAERLGEILLIGERPPLLGSTSTDAQAAVRGRAVRGRRTKPRS